VFYGNWDISKNKLKINVLPSGSNFVTKVSLFIPRFLGESVTYAMTIFMQFTMYLKANTLNGILEIAVQTGSCYNAQSKLLFLYTFVNFFKSKMFSTSFLVLLNLWPEDGVHFKSSGYHI